MCLAVPGRLVSMDGNEPLLRSGRVDFGGVVKSVSLACVPHARIGDYVLVHVGMALDTVDEVEARQVFEYLERVGELAELDEDASARPSRTAPDGLQPS